MIIHPDEDDRTEGTRQESLCSGVLLVFVHLPVAPNDLKLLLKKKKPPN